VGDSLPAGTGFFQQRFIERHVFMAASKKPGVALLNKDKQPELATFKNSLRLWQAQWKAQKASQETPSQQAQPSVPQAAAE
jgi:hypothetical protein